MHWQQQQWSTFTARAMDASEYSFTDVTRRYVWSARLGHERSRPRSRCPSIRWSTTLTSSCAVGRMTNDVCLTSFDMPSRCGLCVVLLLWQPRFPRVFDVRQAIRHCHTWHTVVVSRQSYIVCRDLRFYLWTLRFFT